jgi:hypothetical protein
MKGNSMIAVIKHHGQPVGIVDAGEEKRGLPIAMWFARNVPTMRMGEALADDGGYTIEHGEPDCGDVEALIEGICKRAGVTMSAAFVPFSQSRNAERKGPNNEAWHSLNWRVTIHRAGRDLLTADYGQGSAHAPAHKLPKRDKTKYFERLRAKAVAHECETGMRHDFGEGMMFADGTRNLRQPVPPPSIGEVMQCLARDADALTDYSDFEDWALSMGSDPDSRSAEATYRACMEIGTKLQAGLGRDMLEELRLAAGFN